MNSHLSSNIQHCQGRVSCDGASVPSTWDSPCGYPWESENGTVMCSPRQGDSTNSLGFCNLFTQFYKSQHMCMCSCSTYYCYYYYYLYIHIYIYICSSTMMYYLHPFIHIERGVALNEPLQCPAVVRGQGHPLDSITFHSRHPRRWHGTTQLF